MSALWGIVKFIGFIGVMAGTIALGIYLDEAGLVPCPNDYEAGDVVTHSTGNFRGIIMECRDGIVLVDIGDGSHTNWTFDQVQEFAE